MSFLLDICDNPGVLRTLYFAIIIRDIIFTIIPCGLIIMTLVDFTKAVVAGKEDAQIKSVQLIPKRLIYAVVVFAIPWVVTLFMKVLSDLKVPVALSYKTCVENAETAGNSEDGFKYYDDLYKAEEEAFNTGNSGPTDGGGDNGNSSGGSNYDFSRDENVELASLVTKENNVLQGGQSWSDTPLRVVGGRNRTIGSSGCGFCSLTMVLRSLGYKTITPDVVVKQIINIGMNNYGYAVPADFTSLVSSKKYNYGLKSEVDYNWYCNYSDKASLEAMFEKYKRKLREGKKMIINIPGHYISVIGIRSDGSLYVGDSNIGAVGGKHWRGYNWISPYDMIPNGLSCKEKFKQTDVLSCDGRSYDLSAYRSFSQKGLYTMETLFYFTTTSYIKYAAGEDYPCWKNITLIWE